MPTYKVTDLNNNILTVEINYSEKEINTILENAECWLSTFQSRLGLPELKKADNFDAEVLRFISNEDVQDELDIYWSCYTELRNVNRNEADVENNRFFKAHSQNRLEELVKEMNLFGCNQ